MTVKSRRDRSVSMSSENCDLGLAALGPVDLGAVRGDLHRHAAAEDSRRSRSAGPGATGGRPTRSPALRPTSGAGVRREVELGPSVRVRPRRASRTVPPTRKHSYPASTSRRATCCTGDAGSSSGWRRSGTVVIGAILAPGWRTRRIPFRGSVVSTTRSNRSATVAAMGMRCSRVGCGGHAVASFCFDGRAALVWLDPLDPDRGVGAGVLCARHADTLTPPRGWHLQDRRTRTPSLWVDRPTVTDTPLPATPVRGPPGGRSAGAEPRTRRGPGARPGARTPTRCRSRPRSRSARRRPSRATSRPRTRPTSTSSSTRARRCWRARSPPRRLRAGAPLQRAVATRDLASTRGRGAGAGRRARVAPSASTSAPAAQ